MKDKVYLLIGIALLTAILYLSGDGFYRYPCQDPRQWGSIECEPPLCLASMTCTGFVVRDQDGTQKP